MRSLVLSVGIHYEIGYKVGSQFPWVNCTLCKPDGLEVTKGTWALRWKGHRPIGLDDDVEENDIPKLLSSLETHTTWHMNNLGVDEFIRFCSD